MSNETKTTPVGMVRFSSLRSPYVGNGKYKPKYTVSLAYDMEDEAAVTPIKALHQMIGSKSGVKPEVDKTTMKPTGFLIVGFNSEFPIPVYDSEGTVIPKDKIPSLGAGSMARVQYRVAQTAHGLAKYPSGVQLVKVVEYVRPAPKVDAVAGGSYKVEDNAPEANLGDKPAFDAND